MMKPNVFETSLCNPGYGILLYPTGEKLKKHLQKHKQENLSTSIIKIRMLNHFQAKIIKSIINVISYAFLSDGY